LISLKAEVLRQAVVATD